MCFFTDKFKVEDVIGKAVIIHENPDDYHTQSAGNSGKKLACGVIKDIILIKNKELQKPIIEISIPYEKPLNVNFIERFFINIAERTRYNENLVVR